MKPVKLSSQRFIKYMVYGVPCYVAEYSANYAVYYQLKRTLLNSSGICGVHDETIRVEEIVSYFKECKDLIGKPKLFFIQACRDDDEDDSTDCIDGVYQNKRLCLPYRLCRIRHPGRSFNNQRGVVIQGYSQRILVHPMFDEAV